MCSRVPEKERHILLQDPGLKRVVVGDPHEELTARMGPDKFKILDQANVDSLAVITDSRVVVAERFAQLLRSVLGTIV